MRARRKRKPPVRPSHSLDGSDKPVLPVRSLGASDSLLGISLQAAVPLHIFRYEQKKGPTDFDLERLHRFAEVLGSHGDRLLFKTAADKYGPSTAEMFNRLADAIAVMAFFPGGITTFGTHYESKIKADFRSRIEPLMARVKRREGKKKSKR